jgi:hypothetical protein
MTEAKGKTSAAGSGADTYARFLPMNKLADYLNMLP